jgi:Mu-like prophage I protein
MASSESRSCGSCRKCRLPKTYRIHVVPTGGGSIRSTARWRSRPTISASSYTTSRIKVRLKISITQGDDNGMSGGELPAIGWFEELIDRGVKGLYVVVSRTEEGKLLQKRAFKYFSPEFYEEYQDTETQEVRHQVLVGGGLTNKRYFKELEPMAAFSKPPLMNEISLYESQRHSRQEADRAFRTALPSPPSHPPALRPQEPAAPWHGRDRLPMPRRRRWQRSCRSDCRARGPCR